MSGRSSKRSKRRFSSRSKRPIDKNIVGFSINLSGGNQGEVGIWPPASGPTAGSVFPGTITGIRWHIDCTSHTAQFVRFAWAIVRLRQGQTASALTLPPSVGTMYSPEQDVIVIGSCSTMLQNNTSLYGTHGYAIEGTTKAMRKVQNGDRIIFLCQDDDSATDPNNVNGMIEYFVKT